MDFRVDWKVATIVDSVSAGIFNIGSHVVLELAHASTSAIDSSKSSWWVLAFLMTFSCTSANELFWRTQSAHMATKQKTQMIQTSFHTKLHTIVSGRLTTVHNIEERKKRRWWRAKIVYWKESIVYKWEDCWANKYKQISNYIIIIFHLILVRSIYWVLAILPGWCVEECCGRGVGVECKRWE